MVAVVEAVICAVALLAMTVWYGVRMGSAPLARRVAAMMLPLSQAGALVAFGAFETLDPFLTRFTPWAVFATLVCLVADGFALSNLSEGARRETALEKARIAEELLEATSRGATDAQDEAAQAQETRRDMTRALRRMIEQCEKGNAVGDQGLLSDCLFGHFCRNDVVDALLALKAKHADERGVAFEARAEVPADLAIDDVDLCALFSNLLDNGIRAAAKVENGFVCLDASVRGAMLVVRVVNSCCAEDAGRSLSKARARRKRRVGSHGWGLDILAALAARYDGTFETAAEKDRWTASLVVRCR